MTAGVGGSQRKGQRGRGPAGIVESRLPRTLALRTQRLELRGSVGGQRRDAGHTWRAAADGRRNDVRCGNGVAPARRKVDLSWSACGRGSGELGCGGVEAAIGLHGTANLKGGSMTRMFRLIIQVEGTQSGSGRDSRALFFHLGCLQELLRTVISNAVLIGRGG